MILTIIQEKAAIHMITISIQRVQLMTIAEI